MKLFLGGKAVRPGLTVEGLVELAAMLGVSVLLPTANGLGLAGSAAPTLPIDAS